MALICAHGWHENDHCPACHTEHLEARVARLEADAIKDANHYLDLCNVVDRYREALERINNSSMSTFANHADMATRLKCIAYVAINPESAE